MIGNSDNFIDKLINDRNKLDILFEDSSFDDIEQYYCELICGSQDKNIIKLEDYFNNLINRCDLEALKRNIKNQIYKQISQTNQNLILVLSKISYNS